MLADWRGVTTYLLLSSPAAGNVSPEVERSARLCLCFLRLHSVWLAERFGPFAGLTPGDATADLRVHLCMANISKTGTSFAAALIGGHGCSGGGDHRQRAPCSHTGRQAARRVGGLCDSSSSSERPVALPGAADWSSLIGVACCACCCLAVALAAAHLGCGVVPHVAATGQVTLSGPLGGVVGVAQKIRAAHRWFTVSPTAPRLTNH